MGEEAVLVYYSTENTREYHEIEEQSLEVGSDMAPGVEHLIVNYPEWVKVEDLPLEELEDRMKVAGDLWERGILMTREPLEAHYDDPLLSRHTSLIVIDSFRDYYVVLFIN